MEMNARLGLLLEDDENGARVARVEDFVVIEGAPIQKDDVILRINGVNARDSWRNILKGGTPNSPFCLQFRSHLNKDLRSCTIFKQVINTLSNARMEYPSSKVSSYMCKVQMNASENCCSNPQFRIWRQKALLQSAMVLFALVIQLVLTRNAMPITNQTLNCYRGSQNVFPTMMKPTLAIQHLSLQRVIFHNEAMQASQKITPPLTLRLTGILNLPG